MEVTRFQWAALRRGLICHEGDRVSNTLEEVMRYSVMLGWMCFDQMATMNTRIPLFGEGNFEQLRGDIVDHDEHLEELEQRRVDMEEELERLFARDWDRVHELEERVDTLERMLESTQGALGRVTVEMMRLRAVVNTNNTRLVAVLHGRENPVVVESSPEPEAGPSQFPQMEEGCYVFTPYFPFPQAQVPSAHPTSHVYMPLTLFILSYLYSSLIISYHSFYDKAKTFFIKEDITRQD
jgi:hypothetical protein